VAKMRVVVFSCLSCIPFVNTILSPSVVFRHICKCIVS
jgi:hypothetical protein